MANPHRPLRLNVGFLINAPVGTSRDLNFNYKQMPLGDDLTLSHFSGTARLNRTPQGLLLQASFTGILNLECVRCLTGYDQALKWTMTDLYAFDKRSISESGLIIPENGYINLEPLLREYALLEIPIKPICKSDCKGLCHICGENQNNLDCGHNLEEINSSFSGLGNLLRK